MTYRIAIATSEEFPELEPDSRLLLPALAERGIDATPLVWTDARADWRGWDAILIRSVWDYFDHPTEWAAWLGRIEATGVPLFNPGRVVAWNSHKSYLRELAERAGVPVVDTVMTESGRPVELLPLLEQMGWSDAIVKPAIDGGAKGLFRVADVPDPQARFDVLLAEGNVLVQPFLESIVAEGELSLVYFGGELSHSVRKTAKPGDIRVQPNWGGSYGLVDPEPEAIAIAEQVFAAIPTDLLYARVDLVRADDGTLRLIELEAIEPLLFLELDPDAPGRLAGALAARIGG